MPKRSSSDPPTLDGLSRDAGAPDLGAFDIKTTVEIGQHGLFDRVMFAGIFAVISLLALPWTEVAVWIAMIAAWEAAIGPLLDRAVVRMPERRAFAVYSL